MSSRSALCGFVCFFFLRIRRPPRSTLDRSSAASDVYKRQVPFVIRFEVDHVIERVTNAGIRPKLRSELGS